MKEALLSDDPVLPGEQWFCYWKTSAALWESRVRTLDTSKVHYIPVYWGFHAEGPDQWDYGHYHAERDLKRLVEIFTQHRVRFKWIFPLTPCPLMPNGGTPVYAARHISVGPQGVHLCSFNSQNNLQKMYSYFEPKVFMAFGSFLKSFKEFLIKSNINIPVIGQQYFFNESGVLYSFLYDRSLAFEQGFSRYLKQNEIEDLEDPTREVKLQEEFINEVHGLFKETAKAALKNFWEGHEEVCFLGASPKETIERSLTTGKSELGYFIDLFEHYLFARKISSTLLRHEEKKGLLDAVLKDHFIQGDAWLKDDTWSGLCLFELYSPKPQDFFGQGLHQHLSANYRWLYRFHHEDFKDSDALKIVHAKYLDKTHFTQVLKSFLLGKKIIIDRNSIDPELDKRLGLFYYENNLKVESVKFQSQMTLTQLGEGKLLIYDGTELNKENYQVFWKKVFEVMEVDHLHTELSDDVFSLWKQRECAHDELNYLDVRRVSLFNPTSYKKQVKIHTQGKFAFMRLIDPQKAQAKSTGQVIDVELLPQGRISLDFGHFEEMR